MKFIAIFISAAFSLSAFAEHDAIYCGKIYRGADARTYGEKPMLVLDIDMRVRYNGEWADDFDYGNAYAAIVAAGSVAEARIEKALRSGKPNTRYCAKGRWGGSSYDSWDVTDIDLLSDNIERFDIASAFNIKD